MVSQHAALPCSRLDLWLAATMEMDPALSRLLVRSGVEQRAAAAVRDAAAAAGIKERALTTPAQIVEFFGTPIVVRPDRLVYDLVLWPAHQFIWAISRWGDVGPVGLRVREALPVAPMRVDAGLERLRAHLRPWHHTEHEVRCALGRPDRVMGDGGSSEWLYVLPDERVCVRFAFGWGLLRDISARLASAETLAGGVRWPPGRLPVAPGFWVGATPRRV